MIKNEKKSIRQSPIIKFIEHSKMMVEQCDYNKKNHTSICTKKCKAMPIGRQENVENNNLYIILCNILGCMC